MEITDKEVNGLGLGWGGFEIVQGLGKLVLSWWWLGGLVILLRGKYCIVSIES